MPRKARNFQMANVLTVHNYRHAESIPAGTVLDIPTVGIYVSTTGNLTCVLADSADAETVTFTALPVGFYNLAVRRVEAGSTAVVLGLF